MEDKDSKKSDYTDQVFLLRSQRRSFNWQMPHQPIQNNDQSKGTAFYMKYKNKIHLVTCFHCISNSFHVTISSPSAGAKEYPCRVLWICPELDLAVLEVDEKHKTPPKKYLTPWVFPKFVNGQIPAPDIGAVTLTVGFPLGQTHLKITRGILSGQQSGLYQTDAPINGGNSGGPLMWKNKVIGINARGYFMAQNIAYAIPIMSLLHLIDFHQAHPDIYHIRFPRNWGISISPPATLLLPSTKKSNNAATKCSVSNQATCGVEVKAIYGSQLMKDLSLKKGDILLTINGMPISSLGEIPLLWLKQRMTLHSLLYHIFLDQKIVLEYLSGGKRKKATIVVHPDSDAVAFRQWYPEHEPIPYLYLCGIVIVPFNETITEHRFKYFRDSQQYRDENPILLDSIGSDDLELLKNAEPKLWDKGKIMIINILKGGLMHETHILKVGELIASINDMPVTTIQQAEKIVRESLKKKKDIAIETTSGSRLFLSYDTICKEEQRLMAIYNYKSTFQDLLDPKLQPTQKLPMIEQKQEKPQPQSKQEKAQQQSKQKKPQPQSKQEKAQQQSNEKDVL